MLLSFFLLSFVRCVCLFVVIVFVEVNGALMVATSSCNACTHINLS